MAAISASDGFRWFRKVHDISDFLHPVVAESPILHRVSEVNRDLEDLVHLSIFTRGCSSWAARSGFYRKRRGRFGTGLRREWRFRQRVSGRGLVLRLP